MLSISFKGRGILLLEMSEDLGVAIDFVAHDAAKIFEIDLSDELAIAQFSTFLFEHNSDIFICDVVLVFEIEIAKEIPKPFLVQILAVVYGSSQELSVAYLGRRVRSLLVLVAHFAQ